MWKWITIAWVLLLAACQTGPSATSTPAPTEPQPSIEGLARGEALVLVEGEYDQPSLAALDMDSGGLRILIADTGTITNEIGFAEMPARSPDGTMIAFEQRIVAEIPGGQELRNDGIWLANIDGSDARPLAQPDEPENGQAFTRPTWSPDGTHIAFRHSARQTMYIIPVAGGEAVELLPAALQVWRLAWSSDGERLLYPSERRDETGTLHRGLYIYELETGTETPVMVEENVTYLTPAWSPDSTRITYVRWDLEAELQEIFISNADGSDAVNLTPGQAYAYDPQFSPDGTQIAYNHYNSENQTYSIVLLTLDGNIASESRTLVEVGANDRGPDW
jgi:Tol biopolymer transport system component